MRWIAVALVAGCRAAPAPTPAAVPAPAPVQVSAPAPAHPPKRVLRLDDLRYAAVSDDGRRVATLDPGAYADEPRVVSFSIVEIDSGRVAFERTLQDAARVAQAEQRLAGETFWAMDEMDAPEPSLGSYCDHPPAQTMAQDDVAVRFAFPLLAVRRAGRLVLARDVSSWAAHPSGDCKDKNAMMLHQGFIDLRRRALVVLVGYCGSDTCHEPADRSVVLRI
jgi:hypothetical protein